MTRKTEDAFIKDHSSSFTLYILWSHVSVQGADFTASLNFSQLWTLSLVSRVSTLEADYFQPGLL